MKTIVMEWCINMGICGILGWLFFDQWYLCALGIPIHILFQKKIQILKKQRYQKQFRLEFKDLMLSIYSSLSSGASLEQAIRRSLTDLKRNGKSSSFIITELEMVCQKMEHNRSVIQCLNEMGEHCKNKDFDQFTQVLTLAKKQGGDMAGIVRDSVGNIQRRIESSHEIEGIIGAKRGEFFVMSGIPAGILCYMRLISPDFMDVLYKNIFGRLIMCVCLLVYIAAFVWGLYILKIDNE